MSPSNPTPLQFRLRLFATGAVIGGVLALVSTSPSFAAPSVAAAECPSVNVAPRAANATEIRTGVLCLINAERSQRGLVSLRENVKLRSAAVAHSSDMVRNGYFAHTSLDGDTFVDRILAAGYTSRTAAWSLGENLAWGTGDVSTPRGIHDAWMRSSGHRANILKAGYRELGIGVRPGVPKDAGVGATYTTDFGVKL
ncbi:CAP domain-containing protein [Solirubrobacter soli]|uniref:CAP domain-containing protein n=1 Tax=Solirubrobacter soli TaxID=363832 RepID=UPI0003FFC8C9|nr:CAP domain-containing protein [Solirubrobacter soli]